MFIFEKLTEISWPVVIHVPRDGGKFDKVSVTIRYKRFTDTEKETLLKSSATIAELLGNVVVGWNSGDFGRPDGTTIEYSHESLIEMIDVDYVCRAMHQGFHLANAGVLEKN